MIQAIGFERIKKDIVSVQQKGKIKIIPVNLFLHKNFNTFVENHIYSVNHYLL